MGMLIDGKWTNEWFDPKHKQGKFTRDPSLFRHWVGAEGTSDFPAQSARYHLYLSYACPWACRTLIFLQLKQLREHISISIVDPLMAEHGWEFSDGPDCIPDIVNDCNYLYQVYCLADPLYTGRATVPVLWDKQKQTIVSNESADIIRMLNKAFNGYTSVTTDYYPQHLAQQIDAMNEKIYHNVNNGVYKCGFASTQAAYEQSFDALFSTLDELDDLLASQPYLVGDQISEADWRLFTTLVRFDAVYVGHFKCNKKRIIDYHHLQNYLLELYQMPGIVQTVNMDHIKRHYYQSHRNINPTGIVAKGPKLNFNTRHDRQSKCRRALS